MIGCFYSHAVKHHGKVSNPISSASIHLTHFWGCLVFAENCLKSLTNQEVQECTRDLLIMVGLDDLRDLLQP